ncbi:DNA-binding protein [Cupriavidus sp. 2TAF22]|uniref:DNA-binding protein n=1 Tax=unclassified Cupriavidus TaxID=2640874 RepID=UPI003F93740E
MQNADFPASSRSRAITREDVWQAADALLLAGQRPTIERIRLHLGRGSPNTVSPHLDAWFAGLGARLQDPQAFAAPASLPDPVNQAARYLWEAAQAEARAAAAAGFAEREAALRAAQEALGEKQEELAQERAVLEARLDAADSALAELARARDEATERAARAEAQLVAQQADNDTLRGRLLQAQQQKDALLAEAAGQRAAWDKERETMAERASANERRMALELDAARVALKEGQRQQENERRAAQQKLAEAAEAAARQAGEATRLGNAMAVLEERLRQQEGMLAEYRQRLESRAAGETETLRSARPGPARGRQLRAARPPRFKV